MSLSRPYYYGSDIIDVISYSSKNLTASDQPGPGRVLGKLYTHLGRHVERGLNSIAEHRGLGPLAASLRIGSRNVQRERVGFSSEIEEKQSTKDSEKDCRKLIRYAE